MSDTYKPEWAPEKDSDKFASRVMFGVKGGHDGMPDSSGENSQTKRAAVIKRKRLTVDDYVEGVLNGDRMILSRAITLVESNAPVHFEVAQQVIQKLLPYTGKSTRVGITGVPGAGKSTFIEALGTKLCEAGQKVAVLAVDPSSTVTKGSILGDKTRMENLSRQDNAFIRPSPSGGTLGGLTRKSRETLLLCEAAGYDTILVETVGVGQSETTVRSMVDFFLLVVLTGAGDELQGMKKGVMELADAIVVNKADGDNRPKAMVTRAEYERILHFLRPATENWKTNAYTCSAYTGDGIMELWDGVVSKFMEQGLENGVISERRKQQTLSWVYSMVEEHLHNLFYRSPSIIEYMPRVEDEVVEGKLSATRAVQELIKKFSATSLKAGIDNDITPFDIK
ncbi:MAG TPA: methylmalonyl Co-A mutase-associated GTPase MeaB [Candidatus Avacidaminococcus intestinavium]|uniref:Methylmalonyl Co-A mutase-associated GTPase MeaB n=1 Tax=Candidatus Avacidaminococcus intestinavium TaxID=2840684 RepID=A0A9D1MQ58_9FIRM|nr:methylmalonyl Co-A mutase-associated GTPase MeaB [Candidatus Avacidaminococcus intestinavium]